MSQTHQQPGTGPTVLKIKEMKGADGKPLNIVQKIAAGDYFMFGMCLLQDGNGHEVELIERNHSCKGGVERVTQAILTKWLTNGAAPTHTYQHLIECLRRSELGTLADNIANTTGSHETLSPPPTKKRKSQSADPVTSYAQYLKYRYRQPLPDDYKLPAAPSRYYIELAVIKSEKISRKEADEFTRKTLHGLTEEVMCKKIPIALRNILKPGEDGKPVRCVLVEGAPGAGKSTLAWELCHRWEELECVRQYNLVVLVQLRGKRAQEATCLSDLFPTSGSNMEIEEILASMGNGKGTLLVLDGFDELPHKQRKENSVYIDLIKGAPDMLPEATVVVTSRPSVSADLLALFKHNIDRHLEVLGFTPKQIDEYARSVFSDSKELEAFLKYINNNPVIKGMMYLPLNAVIVASIFQDSYGADCPYPKTMTQLYDALTCSLIRRYLTEKELVSADYRMPTSLQCREEISKLPVDVAKQLLVVARVAYTGICEEKYVFTDLGTEFDYLGMMKKTTSLDMFGTTCSFSFLHLTLQEYLSALYVALELCLEVSLSISEKNMVIRFLAGLCKHGDQALFNKLDKLLQECAIIYGFHPSFELLVVQCVYECDEIVQTVEKVRNLFNSNLINVKNKVLHPLSPFNYYLIGHCIKLGGRWGIEISTKEEVDFLMLHVSAGSVCRKGKVQELDIRSSPLLTFDLLLKLFRHDLCSLEFHTTKFTYSDVTTLQKYILPGSGITRVKLSSSFDESLLATLFRPSSLESLEFGVCYLRTNTKRVNLPSDNSNLKKLTIDTRYGGIDVFKRLAPTLEKCMSLSYLQLSFDVPSEHIPGLVTSHDDEQPSLSSYDVGNTLPLTSLLPTLIEILLSNHTLRELTIVGHGTYSYSHLFEEDVEAMVLLVQLAANSTSLKKLSCNPLLLSLVIERIPKQFHYILSELDDDS